MDTFLLFMVLKMQSHIYAHLKWLATLLISTSHGFKVESGIFVIGKVSSPKIDLHGLGLQTDISV